MKKVIVALLISITILSCKKNDILYNDSTNAEKTITDVSYATASTQQKMDVYLPANRSTTNTYTVVMIHGGSWSGGDKSDFNTDIPNLRPLLGNYAIFNLNYRLANGSTVLLNQQLADIDAAINFIHTKAIEYNINTSKIAVMGASAGAHLSLLKSYKSNADGKVKAVINLFGPTNMTWMYNNHPFPSVTQPIIANVMGTTPMLNASVYTNGSPVNFVSSSVPPTIIFHGTADLVVPISESITLRNLLQTAGVTHQYVEYLNESHGWTGANLNDTYNKAVNFIKTNVK